ncbi:uncharacterized protein LOC107636236 [Arachis ipaensis]|uniref:uncharacterized protein LOC107636236 n=1 Tax=Arachis ipaensis TaxID=130454 RepID=UPI0007AFACE3|nr:uncharacterized protein LOC107636236 [Arachis ipaensis]
MATRGRDRERGRGRLGNANPKTVGNNPVNFMATLENMAAAMQATAEALGNQANHENGDNGGNGPTTLATFLKIHPLIFGGTTNPTEYWWQGTRRLLQQGDAAIPWNTFRTKFYKKYFPNSVRTAKELELLQLKLGQMTVTEYMNMFEELCQFSRICQGAPGGFEEWKCIKYEEGLRSDILSSVGPMEIRIFSDLVNKSKVAEKCLRKAAMVENDHQESYRKEYNPNLTPRNQEFKRNGYRPRPFQGWNSHEEGGSRQGNGEGKQGRKYSEDLRCRMCGNFHLDRPCLLGSGLCFTCRKKGHKSWNCPGKGRRR